MKMIPMSVTCSRDVTKYWLSRAKVNQPSYNVQKSSVRWIQRNQVTWFQNVIYSERTVQDIEAKLWKCHFYLFFVDDEITSISWSSDFLRTLIFFSFLFFFSSGRHDASSDQTQEDRLLVQRLLALWHFHTFLQPPKAGLFRPVGSFSHTGLHIHCISFLYWFPAFSFLIISDLCYFIFVLYLILYQFLNLSTLTLDLFFFFACPC